MGTTVSGLGVMVLAAAVGAGCRGSDREARSPSPNDEAPTPARETSNDPGSRDGSPHDADDSSHEDASRERNGRGPVPCGKLTCSADQYCEIKCTCCGTRIPDPSQASGSYSCLPLPPECATTNEGLCGGKRTREVPCA